MGRELTGCAAVEHSLHKRFRKELWQPFIAAVQRYELVQAGDVIAVCISGGKDSMLLAKLMQELQRRSIVPFETRFLVMDPGYSAENRRKIEDNAAYLGVPVTIRETDIFATAEKQAHSPCYLCARMRRGYLYRFAQDLGCNKIALGHHMDDVIETTLMGMLYGGQLQGMMPKLRSTNFAGMELIRPLYCVRERDIIAWSRYNGLSFLRCACRMTERNETEQNSRRYQVKQLIAALEKEDRDVPIRLFSSLHSVQIDTFPGWKSQGELHSFLERWEEQPSADDGKGEGGSRR